MLSRIVILNDASVARGGATGLALLSIRLLRQRGVPITYIVGDSGANPEFEDLGIEVVPVGGEQLVKQGRMSAFTRGLYNPAARHRVAAWIAANDAPGTVYHLHGWSKILTPAVFSALRPVSARTLIHAHDFFLACPNGAYMDYKAELPCERVPLSSSCLSTNCDKRNYAQKLWRSTRRKVLDSTFSDRLSWAGVAMIHEKMAPYLAKGGVPREQLVTVRNPAEPFSQNRIRAELNETLFFIGRIEAEKGVLELVQAARSVGMPLAMIGDGPLRETLAVRHPEVTFHGWRDREDIRSILQTARGVIMPSRYPEPFGLVAAEASGSGLPILVSDTAFLAEEIVSQGLGFSFRLSDQGSVMNALTLLKEMPADDLAAMSERAHAGTAGLASTPRAWIEQLLALYEGAVARDAVASAA